MSTPTITLVHSLACHLCDDADKALAQLRREYAFSVNLVPAESEAGRALVAEHRPAMFPLVLVDGQYLSTGRLPRGMLRAWLAACRAAVATTTAASGQ